MSSHALMPPHQALFVRVSVRGPNDATAAIAAMIGSSVEQEFVPRVTLPGTQVKFAVK